MGNDQTKFFESVENGDVGTFLKFQQYSKQVNTKDDKFKRTALHYAVSNNQIKIVELLLSNQEIDINSKDINGNTALMLGCRANSFESVTRLLKSITINIDAQNDNGDTALHIACSKSNQKMITLLLQNGASRTIENKDSKLPIDLALSQDLKKLFSESGDIDFSALKLDPIAEAGSLKRHRAASMKPSRIYLPSRVNSAPEFPLIEDESKQQPVSKEEIKNISANVSSPVKNPLHIFSIPAISSKISRSQTMLSEKVQQKSEEAEAEQAALTRTPSVSSLLHRPVSFSVLSEAARKEKKITSLEQENKELTEKMNKLQQRLEKLKVENDIYQNIANELKAKNYELEKKAKEFELQAESVKNQQIAIDSKYEYWVTMESKLYSEIHALKSKFQFDLNSLVVQEEIGRGSFGQVFKCKWNGAGGGITVAKKQFFVTEDFVTEETMREIELLTACHHPNIIRVYGYCIVDKTVSIVMEYSKHGTLTEYLKKNCKKLSTKEQWRLAKDAATAVNFLHTKNVMHRDIKSANFLISEKNSLQLFDFGMSRLIDRSMASKIGSAANGLGSIRWKAPEAFDDIPWTRACDIYSLGVTFWEIATQLIPWANLSDGAIIKQVCVNQNRPEIPKEIDPQFKEMIEMCWHSDPSKRWKSSEIVEYISKFYEE